MALFVMAKILADTVVNLTLEGHVSCSSQPVALVKYGLEDELEHVRDSASENRRSTSVSEHFSLPYQTSTCYASRSVGGALPRQHLPGQESSGRGKWKRLCALKF